MADAFTPAGDDARPENPSTFQDFLELSLLTTDTGPGVVADYSHDRRPEDH